MNNVFSSRTAMKWLTRILMVCIVLQVFLAGSALFWNLTWATHISFARILFVLPVLLLITSLIARLPVSLRLHSAGLIGLVLLIAVSAFLRIGFVSALHPVLAMTLFGATRSLARKIDEL